MKMEARPTWFQDSNYPSRNEWLKPQAWSTGYSDYTRTSNFTVTPTGGVVRPHERALSRPVMGAIPVAEVFRENRYQIAQECSYRFEFEWPEKLLGLSGEFSFEIRWVSIDGSPADTPKGPFADDTSAGKSAWSLTVDLSSVAKQVFDVASYAVAPTDRSRTYVFVGRMILAEALKGKFVYIRTTSNLAFDWHSNYAFGCSILMTLVQQYLRFARLPSSDSEEDEGFEILAIEF